VIGDGIVYEVGKKRILEGQPTAESLKMSFYYGFLIPRPLAAGSFRLNRVQGLPCGLIPLYFNKKAVSLIGPGSIPWEIGNAFSSMFKQNRLTLDEAGKGLIIFDSIPLRYINQTMLMP